MKIKSDGTTNKYLDRVKKLKKPWNMKVTMISVVVGVLGAIPCFFV